MLPILNIAGTEKNPKSKKKLRILAVIANWNLHIQIISASENKKFLYSTVKTGVRAREYENALNCLKNANLVSKVHRITKPGLPLSAYDDLDAFKIYMVDVGLLRRHSHLASSAFAENTRLFTEFKGALTENYVSLCAVKMVKDAQGFLLEYEGEFTERTEL